MLVQLFQMESAYVAVGNCPVKTVSLDPNLDEKETIEFFKKEFIELLKVTDRLNCPDILKVLFLNELDEGRGVIKTASTNGDVSFFPVSFSAMPAMLRNENGTIKLAYEKTG